MSSLSIILNYHHCRHCRSTRYEFQNLKTLMNVTQFREYGSVATDSMSTVSKISPLSTFEWGQWHPLLTAMSTTSIRCVIGDRPIVEHYDSLAMFLVAIVATIDNGEIWKTSRYFCSKLKTKKAIKKSSAVKQINWIYENKWM